MGEGPVARADRAVFTHAASDWIQATGRRVLGLGQPQGGGCPGRRITDVVDHRW